MDGLNPNLKSSTSALMKEFHAITHNIANASTAGFKRRMSSFSGELAEQSAKLGKNNSVSKVEFNSNIDFSQGHLNHTERPLDVAIIGEGFFVVEGPEGAAYTRNGQFRRSSAGQLVDFQGRMISGENGPITIPPEVSDSDLDISGDGSIYAAGANVGKLRMVEFGAGLSGLEPIGDNCYKASEGTLPVPAISSGVEQGYMESSNVDTVKETVNLMTVSRMYEASMKVISKKSDSTKAILDVAMG